MPHALRTFLTLLALSLVSACSSGGVVVRGAVGFSVLTVPRPRNGERQPIRSTDVAPTINVTVSHE
jgi:heme A synthase